MSLGRSQQSSVRRTLYVWGPFVTLEREEGQQCCAVAANEVLEVEELKDVAITSITAGDYGALATVNGEVYSWGLNKEGELGQPGGNVPRPTLIEQLKDIYVTKVCTNHLHTLILTQSGEVWAFGSGDSDGRLGRGPEDKSEGYLAKPTVKCTDSRIVDIAVTRFHNLILDENGVAYGFGYGSSGRCGTGSNENVWVPTPIKMAVSVPLKIRAVAPGGMYSLFLDEMGRVWASGCNDSYQLGLGHTDRCPNMELIGFFIDNHIQVRDISCGYHHSTAIDVKGKLYTWGGNNSLQLGYYTESDSDQPIPRQVEDVLADQVVFKVSASMETTLVLTERHTVFYCGGKNKEPMQAVTALMDKRAVDIASGADQQYVVIEDGVVSLVDLCVDIIRKHGLLKTTHLTLPSELLQRIQPFPT